MKYFWWHTSHKIWEIREDVSVAFKLLELICIIFLYRFICAVGAIHYLFITKKLSMWVCFGSSSKQNTLIKTFVALGIHIVPVIFYGTASWQKCHRECYAINILLWLPHQQTAPVLAGGFNYQPSSKAVPQSSFQPCCHKPGVAEAEGPGPPLPPSAHATTRGTNSH